MTIDISKYEKHKERVISWFNDNDRDVSRTVSMTSSMLSIPCIAIAYWLGEETNWNEASLRSIRILTEFYDYTEIIGKPSSAPF